MKVVAKGARSSKMPVMSFQEKILLRSELRKWRETVRQSGQVLVVTKGPGTWSLKATQLVTI